MEVWSDGPLIELVSETACLHSEVDRHTAVLQSFDTKLSIVGKGQTETPDLTGHDFARSKSSQLEQTIRERALEHKMITTQRHRTLSQEMIEKKIDELEQKLFRITHIQKKLLNEIISFLHYSVFKNLTLLSIIFVAFHLVSSRLQKVIKP